MNVDYTATVEEFEWDIPESSTVTSVIDEYADEIGDRVAVRYLNEDGNSTEQTHADLRDDMNRFANGLEESASRRATG